MSLHCLWAASQKKQNRGEGGREKFAILFVRGGGGGKANFFSSGGEKPLLGGLEFVRGEIHFSNFSNH